jgi:putative aldouronate transport system substrate-binding protein
MFLSRDHIVADLPQVMEALFTDLTPFVSGDNVLEYPNLAALPTSAWVWPSVNQHIYAVPIVRPPFNWMPYINENRWEEVGAAFPTNAQELKEALQLLTNPREEQYGFGAIPPNFGLVAGDGMNFLALFGVPHNWAVDSEGRFTKDIESEQFREALAFVRDIYQSGLMYPDANVNLGDLRNLLIEGNIGLTFSGHLAFQAFLWPVGQDADPPQEIGYLPWFSANGGDLVFYAYHGVNGFQMIKKADDERVRELLRIMDYMAAPFGSEEYQLTRYGIEGEHFEFNDQGIPELTEQGEEDVMQSVGWEDVATAVAVIGPAEEALVSKMHGYSSEVSQYQIPDGALGYYSATDRERGQTLLDRFHQGIGEIVRGQRDESDLDGLLDEWRSGGGDAMRSEYEEAYASAN